MDMTTYNIYHNGYFDTIKAKDLKELRKKLITPGNTFVGFCAYVREGNRLWGTLIYKDLKNQWEWNSNGKHYKAYPSGAIRRK